MAQIQFRSDDTTKWKYGYGNGSAGDETISTNTTLTPARTTLDLSASSTSATLTAASSFSNGDLVVIIQLQGTNVGSWHLNKIVSGAGTTSVTLEISSPHTYDTSTSNVAQIIKLTQYKSFTVNSGSTLDINAWDGSDGGLLPILVNGPFINNGTIDLSEIGFRGGGSTATAGFAGEGTTTTVNSVESRNPSGTSGGGTNGGGDQAGGAGGGHAAAGGDGQLGRSQGGDAGGSSDLTTMIMGGAGGSWYENSGSRPGDFGGGDSGAMLMVIAKDISGTGTITFDGANAPNPGWGGGGGGSAGAGLFKGMNIDLSSMTVTAQKGLGGNGTSIDGGDGSDGRLHADYSSSFSGTTTPTISTRQDNTLATSASSILTVF